MSGVKDALVTAHPEKTCPRNRSQLTAHPDHDLSADNYAVGKDAEAENRDRVAITRSLAGTALRVRMLGSAAIDLAWLAQGSTGATIMLGNLPWDTAAGVVIARGAGAKVTDIEGHEHTMRSATTVATAPAITGQTLALIKEALSTSR